MAFVSVTIILIDEVKDEEAEDVASQVVVIVVQFLKHLIFLHVIELTHIVHLVDNEFFDVACVEFRVALDGQDSLADHPDLVLGPV